MKRFFLLITVILSVFHMSCEDTRMEGMSDDKIGFLKSGEQVISAFIASSELEFEVVVHKSGIGKKQTTVSIEPDTDLLKHYNESRNTELKVLPDEYYSIENKEFNLNGNVERSIVKIKIDVKKLEELQGVQTQMYAVPLKLKTTGEIETSANRSDLIIIPEIKGGIRPNSAVTLFNKTFDQMGINPTNHNTASFAVSSKYVFVNTRNEDLKYYDRFTGEYVGEIPLPFKGSLSNFTVTNDEKDNLLITNLRNAASGLALQTIYRIKGTSAPEKYIEFNHVYPNGRKLSITGDLDKDAIITSTVEKSSNVLYWTVQNGVLTSQEPQVFVADPTQVLWTTLADAVALDANLDKGMYIAGNGTLSVLGYFDKDGRAVAKYDLLGGSLDPAVFRTQALSYSTFNGAKYLAVGSQQGPSAMQSMVLDVTKPSNLTLGPNSQGVVAYRGPDIVTMVNTNATADIHLKLSEDKSTMTLYSLGTNGRIMAVQFDGKLSE